MHSEMLERVETSDKLMWLSEKVKSSKEMTD